MKLEADHKRELVREVNALPGGYARRLEDRWAVGLLDLIVKLPHQPLVWAEGKIVKGQSFGPTQRQWVEGKRLEAAGMRALLIGWKDGETAISPWALEARFEDCLRGRPALHALQLFMETVG